MMNSTQSNLHYVFLLNLPLTTCQLFYYDGVAAVHGIVLTDNRE